MSPATAARAPQEVRARASCAGVEGVSAEWWGTPNLPSGPAVDHLYAEGKAAGACLAALFDSTQRLKYMDGESRLESKEKGWTVADLAAALAAHILGESYDASAAPDARAARRQELRAKLK